MEEEASGEAAAPDLPPAPLPSAAPLSLDLPPSPVVAAPLLQPPPANSEAGAPAIGQAAGMEVEERDSAAPASPLGSRHYAGRGGGDVGGASPAAAVAIRRPGTELWAFGRGDCGQLGTDSCEDAHVPRMVEGLRGRDVVNAAPGGLHSAAVTCECPVQPLVAAPWPFVRRANATCPFLIPAGPACLPARPPACSGWGALLLGQPRRGTAAHPPAARAGGGASQGGGFGELYSASGGLRFLPHPSSGRRRRAGGVWEQRVWAVRAGALGWHPGAWRWPAAACIHLLLARAAALEGWLQPPKVLQPQNSLHFDSNNCRRLPACLPVCRLTCRGW